MNYHLRMLDPKLVLYKLDGITSKFHTGKIMSRIHT